MNEKISSTAVLENSSNVLLSSRCEKLKYGKISSNAKNNNSKIYCVNSYLIIYINKVFLSEALDLENCWSALIVLLRQAL